MGIYEELVKTGSVRIFTGNITNDNLDEHFMQIMNLMRDGIETDILQHGVIYVDFADGESVKLSVFRYFYNLISGNFRLVAMIHLHLNSYSSREIYRLVRLRNISMRSLLRNTRENSVILW